jgi:hypothetical protein
MRPLAIEQGIALGAVFAACKQCIIVVTMIVK